MSEPSESYSEIEIKVTTDGRTETFRAGKIANLVVHPSEPSIPGELWTQRPFLNLVHPVAAELQVAVTFTAYPDPERNDQIFEVRKQ